MERLLQDLEGNPSRDFVSVQIVSEEGLQTGGKRCWKFMGIGVETWEQKQEIKQLRFLFYFIFCPS